MHQMHLLYCILPQSKPTPVQAIDVQVEADKRRSDEKKRRAM